MNEEYRVYCDSCFLDDEFPTDEHANTMKVYHDATFDCNSSAVKEKV